MTFQDQKFNILIIISIFLFLHNYPSLTLATDATKSTNLIKKVCDATKEKSFCTQVLESNPRANSASTMPDLALVTMDLARENAINTLNFFQEMLKNPQIEPSLKTALETCAGPSGYGHAAISFKCSLNELKKDAMTSNYDVSIVSDDIKICEDAMTPSKGINYNIQHSIADKNNVMKKFQSITVAATNILQLKQS